MHECSNLANERPISLKPNSRTDSEFLSPNSLLLGRTSSRISSGPFEDQNVFIDDPKHAKTRFLFIQTIVNQFWRVWMKLCFPSLLIRQKWHTEQRNLKTGDVCLLQDSSTYRGEWRLARVSETYPDRRGNVRNVELMIKPKQDEKKEYKSQRPIFIKRHVNHLIVIVPAEDMDNKDGTQIVVPAEDKDAQTEVMVTTKDVMENYIADNDIKSTEVEKILNNV